jgi:carbamate kinase
VDRAAAATLLDAGYVVACAGGGGIPVVDDGKGAYRGVEAVIDKDLTAALLAAALGADALIIATDVDAVMIGWGTPQATPLGAVAVAELRAHSARGAFASGSMGPKVEAACRFAESGHGFAAIASLEHVEDALDGKSGTIVTA